jgi:hypothetical protein
MENRFIGLKMRLLLSSLRQSTLKIKPSLWGPPFWRLCCLIYAEATVVGPEAPVPRGLRHIM